MLVGSAGFVPGAAESPKSVTETIAQIEAFDSPAEINAFSLTATAAVKTVAHVLEELKGEISAESFLKGAGEIEEFETGLAAPLTTTKPGPIPRETAPLHDAGARQRSDQRSRDPDHERIREPRSDGVRGLTPGR